MKIDKKSDEEKSILTFSIEGELDIHNVKLLKSELVDSIEQKGWIYILDLAKVSYLDSSGLGMLVHIKKTLNKNNSELRLVNLNSAVMNVFKLTKLDEYFKIE